MDEVIQAGEKHKKSAIAVKEARLVKVYSSGVLFC
jgi:hypothetical protein